MGWLGYQELALIGLLALIVVGPTRMPEFYRQAGKVASWLRRTALTLRRELEQEVPYDDMEEISSIGKSAVTAEDLSEVKDKR